MKQFRANILAITIICGACGFVLLMWTPTTTHGLIVYDILLAIAILIAGLLVKKKRQAESKEVKRL